MAANWGWGEAPSALKSEFSGGTNRPASSASSHHAPPLHAGMASQVGRPHSPQRPGSSLRPGSRGGSKCADITSAEAATAAAAALLQEQDKEGSFGHIDESKRNNNAAPMEESMAQMKENMTGSNKKESYGHVEDGKKDSNGVSVEEDVSSGSSSGNLIGGAVGSLNKLGLSSKTASSDTTGQSVTCDGASTSQGGLLRHAAKIMAEDNDIDTKVNSSIPGNHSAMPVSQTTGVASNAISCLTLEDRPRFSVIDSVVEEFVQGFVELERRLHLSRAQTDRDFLARLAEAQTRLLVEGDLGFSSTDIITQGTAEKETSRAIEGKYQTDQSYATRAHVERDERLVTQLELHHGEISELMWSALATKGEVQRRGARELMDHAVTELRSCLERQEEEFKKHSAWLKAVCERKIAAARAAGDTAYAQATREAESRFNYRLKLMRRHHADEMLGQESKLGEDYKDALEKREFFENKFRALERAQQGYMEKITSSEKRAIKAEAESQKNSEIARKATRKARMQETELRTTAEACAKAERQNAKLKRTRDSLNEKLTNSQRKVVALEGDLSIRGAKIIALEEAIAEQNVNTSGVAERVKAEKERQRLRELEMETMKADLQNAKMRASRTSSIVSRQTEVIEKLRSDLHDLESENDHLSQECTEREQHIHDLEGQCANARREVDQMRHKLMESSKHNRRMSVQLNEKLAHAYAAVRNVVENVSSPPPDFDPGRIQSESLLQHSQNVYNSGEAQDYPATGEWAPVRDGDSLIAGELNFGDQGAASDVIEPTPSEHGSNDFEEVTTKKEGDNIVDPGPSQEVNTNDSTDNNADNEDTSVSEPPRQRTYEEIMWERGAAEREAAAEAKRLEEEKAAAAKKQEEEEEAMMAALLESAAKAEKAEKRAKRNAKRARKSKKPTKKKKRKSKGDDSTDSLNVSGKSTLLGSSNSSMKVGGSSRPSSGARGNSAKWKVLRTRAAEAMDHLRIHVNEAEKSKPAVFSPSSGTDAGESHAAMERRLEIELRESIETELRRKVQREFEKKLVGGLRARLAREIERKAKIAFKKRIDAELAKIRLTPDETRDALEEERKATKNLEGEVDDLTAEIRALREEAASKDKGAAELALLVREKDMLLTEMTLLVRAYKDELKTEKANLQSAQMLSGKKSGRTRSEASSSRPQSSKLSSRSSRPQSRQRPHTANPVPKRSERLKKSDSFPVAADEARREWEEERDREELERMHAMKQRANPLVELSDSRALVKKLTGESSKSRIDIPGATKRKRGLKHEQPSQTRPTTAPVKRTSKIKSKSKRRDKVSLSKKHQHAALGRQALKQSLISSNQTEEDLGQSEEFRQPYVPAALIRTSLRDGFVLSDSISGRAGPDGIELPQPLSMQATRNLNFSQSQPAVRGNKGGISRPKSSPFIRFGSAGIQELLERKRRTNGV